MVQWKMTAKTGSIKYDCTLNGIQKRCGGCCVSTTLTCWPPKSGDGGVCPALGENGCQLGMGRPVTCHLYPLRLNPNNTLILHGATRFPNMCKGNRNHPDGPMLVDALRFNLIALFGEQQVSDARESFLSGNDFYFTPLNWVIPAIKMEEEFEEKNLPPISFLPEVEINLNLS